MKMVQRCQNVLVGFVAIATLVVIGGPHVALARQDNPAPKEVVQRVDLANAYRRLDAQFMQRFTDRDADPPEAVSGFSKEWLVWTLMSERALAGINTACDRAAMSFFSGDIADVTEKMNALLVERPGSERDADFAAMARSLHLDISPPRPTVEELTQDGHCTFRVSSMYPLPEGAGLPTELALMVTFNEPKSSHASINQIMLRMDESRRLTGAVRVHLAGPIEAGVREISLRSGGMGFDTIGAPQRTIEPIGRWTVLPESIAEARTRLGKRLDLVEPQEASDSQRLAGDLFRTRLGLLDLADSAIDSIALLTDYAQLIADLNEECAAIEAGRNPYAGRGGDLWTGVPLIEDVHFPARIYMPESALKKNAIPLVIALHGAGGDENLFMDAYGAGIIKRLADEHGFAVVSPRASPMMDLGMAFDSIVKLMRALYPIDENRIYVLGHSMGGMMTGGMSAARHDRIAAACWLAGGSFARGATIPPTLAICGQLDLIVPADRVKAVVDVAQRAGMEIEYREVPNLGHVLVVGVVLSDAMDWLLTHALDEPAHP